MADKKTIAFDHHTTDWVADPYSHYHDDARRMPRRLQRSARRLLAAISLPRRPRRPARLADLQLQPSRTHRHSPHQARGAPRHPIGFNPPDHTRYRDVVSQYFSPSTVKKHEPQVTIHTNTLYRQLSASGRLRHRPRLRHPAAGQHPGPLPQPAPRGRRPTRALGRRRLRWPRRRSRRCRPRHGGAQRLHRRAARGSQARPPAATSSRRW